MKVQAKISRTYRPTYEQWMKVRDNSLFDATEFVPYSSLELIDFKYNKVHLKGGRRIAFTDLSESEYIWVCNGGYFAQAVEINNSDRV